MTFWGGSYIAAMKTVTVFNISKGKLVLDKASVADTFLLRLRGLLGRKGLAPGEGLIINPCNAVHTLGMAFPIDVAFVDDEGCICHIVEAMPPNKLGRSVKNARYVIEGSAGLFSAIFTEVGDKVRLKG